MINLIDSRIALISKRHKLPESEAKRIVNLSILTTLEKQAFYLVKQIGYNPSTCIELVPGIFSILATKEGERYNLKVDANEGRIISNDLLFQMWGLNPETNEHFIRDVKRFSRSTKE